VTSVTVSLRLCTINACSVDKAESPQVMGLGWPRKATPNYG
jgi:hypothetical protein